MKIHREYTCPLEMEVVSPMIKKLDHIVITTANVPACLDFYGRLGFDVREAGGRYELFAGDFKINVHLLGHELLPHATNVKTGSADICLELEGDIKEYKHMLEGKGLAVELGVVPRTGVRGAMKSLYLYDPDGNLVELSSYS